MSEENYPPDQKYRVFKIEFEDGTIIDYPCVWWDDDQMALIPDEFRDELAATRDQALWLGFEKLFNGELPGYGKAKRILAEHNGPKGSEPPWWRYVR